MTGALLPRAFALALGCILLAAMAKALKTGSTQLVDQGVRRQAEPILYWTVIAVSSVAGVLLVLAAVFSPGHGALPRQPSPVTRQLASFGPQAARPT